jgi:hypothetical protein
MKRFLYITLFCIFTCSSLVAWFSPQFISWYFTPPADLVLSCKPAVEWGIEAYRKMVLIGALFGLVIGVAICIIVKNRSKTTAPVI